MAGDWQPVRGYEGRYDVSNDGQVRQYGGRILKQWANDRGYALVRLSGPRAVVRVHRLVGEAFLPNPDSLPVINHLDCDPQNNNASNLEWCTQKHNLAHAAVLGRLTRDYWAGRRSPNALLDAETVREIRNAYAGGGCSQAQLGQRFGISKRAIGRLLARETYADV